MATLMCAKSAILVILRGVEKEAVFRDSRAREKRVIKAIEWCKGIDGVRQMMMMLGFGTRGRCKTKFRSCEGRCENGAEADEMGNKG